MYLALILQDSLTDMSYFPVHIEVAGVRDTYVHGVYRPYTYDVCAVNQVLFPNVHYTGYVEVSSGHHGHTE